MGRNRQREHSHSRSRSPSERRKDKRDGRSKHATRGSKKSRSHTKVIEDLRSPRSPLSQVFIPSSIATSVDIVDFPPSAGVELLSPVSRDPPLSQTLTSESNWAPTGTPSSGGGAQIVQSELVSVSATAAVPTMTGLLNTQGQSPSYRDSPTLPPYSEAVHATLVNSSLQQPPGFLAINSQSLAATDPGHQTRVTWSLTTGPQTAQAIQKDKPWTAFLHQLQSRGQLSEQEAATLRGLIHSRPATGHGLSETGTDTTRSGRLSLSPGLLTQADRYLRADHSGGLTEADRLRYFRSDHSGGLAEADERRHFLPDHSGGRQESDRSRPPSTTGGGTHQKVAKDKRKAPTDRYFRADHSGGLTEPERLRYFRPDHSGGLPETERQSSRAMPHLPREDRPSRDRQEDPADQGQIHTDANSAKSWDIPSYRDDRSQASSASQYSSSGSDQDSEDEIEDKILTFNEALKAIQKVDKTYLVQRPEQKAKATTASDQFLRPSASPASAQLPLVREATMVTTAVKSALEAARGSTMEWPQGAIPEFPDGLPEGKFLKATSTLYIKGTPRPAVQHQALPAAFLEASRDDMTLVPQGQSPKIPATISAVGLSQTEEMLRRALEACSVMDAFLGSMFNALRTPGLKHFEVSPEVNSQLVGTLGETACEALKAMTNSVARAHLNLTMAKRDALLAKSNSVRSTHTRTALRTAPLNSGSLFGGLAGPLLKRQAEANRDLAFALPQRPHPRPAQAPQKRPFSQPRATPPAKRPRPQGQNNTRRPQFQPSNKRGRPGMRPAGPGRQAYRPHPQ